VDVAATLGPPALARLVRDLADRSPMEQLVTTEDADTAIVDGQPVVTVRAGDWTALISAGSPRRLVWLGGPLNADGPLRPIVFRRGDTGRIVPAAWSGHARTGVEPVPVAQPPYVSITPVPVGAAEAEATRVAVAWVVPPAKPAVDQGDRRRCRLRTAPSPSSLPWNAGVTLPTASPPLCTWSMTVTGWWDVLRDTPPRWPGLDGAEPFRMLGARHSPGGGVRLLARTASRHARVPPCSASSRALYAAIHKLAAHAISCSAAVNKRPRTFW
jgi:hypothetical protein